MHTYTRALLDAIPIPNLLKRGSMKRLIKGEVTSPINPDPGCRFAARCPDAKEGCRSNKLELKEVSQEHFVACRLFD